MSFVEITLSRAIVYVARLVLSEETSAVLDDEASTFDFVEALRDSTFSFRVFYS